MTTHGSVDVCELEQDTAFQRAAEASKQAAKQRSWLCIVTPDRLQADSGQNSNPNPVETVSAMLRGQGIQPCGPAELANPRLGPGVVVLTADQARRAAASALGAEAGEGDRTLLRYSHVAAGRLLTSWVLFLCPHDAGQALVQEWIATAAITGSLWFTVARHLAHAQPGHAFTVFLPTDVLRRHGLDGRAASWLCSEIRDAGPLTPCDPLESKALLLIASLARESLSPSKSGGRKGPGSARRGSSAPPPPKTHTPRQAGGQTPVPWVTHTRDVLDALLEPGRLPLLETVARLTGSSLPAEAVAALLALHDLGKLGQAWQDAAGAGPDGPLAKSGAPVERLPSHSQEGAAALEPVLAPDPDRGITPLLQQALLFAVAHHHTARAHHNYPCTLAPNASDLARDAVGSELGPLAERLGKIRNPVAPAFWPPVPSFLSARLWAAYAIASMCLVSADWQASAARQAADRGGQP
jgi:CRISPR-associated endonuclease Cas3-HD